MSEYGKVSEGPGGFNRFGSNKYLGGEKAFLESNSIIAKFAFSAPAVPPETGASKKYAFDLIFFIF